MALNDRSPSEIGRGAVLTDSLCACVLSGSIKWLLFGEGSRGLGSSRIDFVLESRVNPFGLPFLTTFAPEEEGGASVWESRETSDLEGPPTGRRVVALSLESIHGGMVSEWHLKRRDETSMSRTSSPSFL
jgi:hypothetical protein